MLGSANPNDACPQCLGDSKTIRSGNDRVCKLDTRCWYAPKAVRDYSMALHAAIDATRPPPDTIGECLKAIQGGAL